MAWAKLNEPAGTAYSPPERLFPADNWWNLDISAAPLDAQSAAYISFFYPDNNLNFSLSGDFGDNYGVPHITVSGDYPKVFFSHIYYQRTSDLGLGFPIPAEALTTAGWTQDLTRTLSDQIASGYDRHMCIVDVDNSLLYEMYQPFYNAGASPVAMYDYLVQPGEYAVGSCRRFDLSSNDNSKAGSTNAAGLAFLPGHFTYDEVMGANPIAHALNLTLNFSTRYAPYFVWPATDYAPGSASSPVSGENGLGHPPFGARFRLKASYVPTYNDPYANKVIACLKTYGCIFMDNGPNGNIAGGQDSRWGNYEAYPRNYIGYELQEVHATDFEIVELGWNPPSVPVVGPGRPIDLTTTTWTGASTDVSDASDTTYIESPATPLPAQTFTCTLQAVTTPVGSYTHQVRVRAATIGTDPLAMVLALENTDDNSVVATRTIANVPPTLADQVFGLDSNEISLIHSYAGLRIRGYALASDTTTYFIWTAVSGATSYVLQVRPSASGTYDTFNANVGNVLTYSLALVPGTYYSRVVPQGAGSATAEQTVTVT